MIKGDIRLSRFWQRLLGLSPMGGIGESYRGWVFKTRLLFNSHLYLAPPN